MKPWMHRLYLKEIRQCIDAFELIKNGDRILVGVSGGKDSSLLFYALTQLQKMGLYDFEVEGLTVDHGMLGELDAYRAFCQSQGLKLNVHEEHYAVDLSHENPYNPCYTCSRLRKGIVKKYAINNNFNKIAFGHTKDDLVETLLMNVLKHGKLSSIPPLLKDKTSNIEMIRPLIYVEESNILKAVSLLEFPLMKDLCTFAKKRTRSNAEGLVKLIETLEPSFSTQLLKAMHHIEADRLLDRRKL